jgi:acetyltransferase-like isoleucine patch superfamily enzyme
VKGMVDVYVPFETTVNLTNVEFTKLLNEYRDMLLEINEDSKFPEPNPQYSDHETIKKISIKDIVAKMDGNFNAGIPCSCSSNNTPRSKRGSKSSINNDTEISKNAPDLTVNLILIFRWNLSEKV